MQALQSVANDLYEIVDKSDPRRSWWDEAPERCRHLVDRLESLRAELTREKVEASARTALDEVLATTATNARRFARAVSEHPRADEVRQLHASLARNYVQLVQVFQTVSTAPPPERFRRLVPFNYTRNAFHVLSGLTGALCYQFLLSRAGAAIIMAMLVGTFSTLELLRRYSGAINARLTQFGPIARIIRAEEYGRVNSATYFVWGLLFAVLVADQRAVEAGCLVLAFGDPAACLFGKRWGRRKIIGDKSWVGTGAFVAVAAIVTFVFQVLCYSAVPVTHALGFSLVAAVIGATIELVSTRIDDNFTIPLGVAIAMTLIAV